MSGPAASGGADAHLIASVGRNIARLRSDAGWSISELARRAEVGKATISTLEAGDGNPGLETLVAISVAFGVPFSVLTTDPIEQVSVQRCDDAPRTASENGTLTSYLQWSTGRVQENELYRFDLVRGETYVAEGHPAGVQETLVCVRGRVRVGPVGSEVTLAAGDRASFAADRPHTYAALTKQAELVCMLAYR